MKYYKGSGKYDGMAFAAELTVFVRNGRAISKVGLQPAGHFGGWTQTVLAGSGRISYQSMSNRVTEAPAEILDALRERSAMDWLTAWAMRHLEVAEIRDDTIEEAIGLWRFVFTTGWHFTFDEDDLSNG